MIRSKTEMRQLFACFFSLSIALATSVLPMTASAQSADPAAQTSYLDLSSSSSSMAAANKTAVNIQFGGSLSSGKVTGGTAMSVLPGQLVTAAQYMAVLGASSGNQTVLLNGVGAAQGGSLNLSSAHVQNLAGLVVPAGVTINAIGYNQATPLNIAGNLNISGALYSLQTAPNLTSVLNMANLNIASGGVLSGGIPAGMSLPGLFSSAGMQLNVAGNVSNYGIIDTPGLLSIVAGGSIANQSNNGVQALMAAQNINLVSGAGSIVNSGLIQALGSMNLNTLDPHTNLLIDNRDGILQALASLNLPGVLDAGVINIRANDEDLESASIGIFGGRLDAVGGINLFGKNMETHVDSINGAISCTGSVAQVSIESGDLRLGNQLLTGDPTYFNKSGDIQIASLTSVAGDLAIVASGSITTAAATTITATTNNSVFLSAGYNFSETGGTNITSFVSNAPGNTSTVLTFTGTSNGSENINLANNTLSISTSGTGSITMLSTGSTNFGSPTPGTVQSANGNILLVPSNGISKAGSITASGTGNVTIAAANVSSMTGITVTNGTVSALPTPTTPTSKNLTLATVSSAGGNVSISTDGQLNLGGAVSAAGAGKTVTITSSSDIIGNGKAINAGGNIVISSVFADLVSIGTVTSTGGSITLNGKEIQVNGSVSASGNVNLTANTNSTFNFNTATAGATTITGTVSGNNVSITNQNTGAITFNSSNTVAVSGSTSIAVTAGVDTTVSGGVLGSGNGTLANAKGQLSAPTVSLTAFAKSTGASGQIGTPIQQLVVNASSLSFTSKEGNDNNANVYINDVNSGNTTLGVASSFSKDLTYVKLNGGNIAIGSGLTSTDNGTISIGISGAAGSITNTGGTNTISAGLGTVILSTFDGNIGATALDPVKIQSANIQITAGGSGNAFIQANATGAGSVALNTIASSAGGTFSFLLNNAGDLTVFKAVSGQSTTVQTSNGSININVAGNKGLSASNGNLTLTAGGAASVINIQADTTLTSGGSGDVLINAGVSSGKSITGAHTLSITSAKNIDATLGGGTGLIETKPVFAASGFAVNFQAPAGFINLHGSALDTSANTSGSGGNITLNALNNITSGALTAKGLGSAGGVISVTSKSGQTRTDGNISNTGTGSSALTVGANSATVLTIGNNVAGANTISGILESNGTVDISNSGAAILLSGSAGKTILSSDSLVITAGNGNINGTGTEQLTSSGNISIISNLGSIGSTSMILSAASGKTITLNATAGNASASSISGNPVSLSATVNGNFNFNNSNGGTITLASDITSTGNGAVVLTVAGAAGSISSTGNKSINSTNGTMTFTTLNGTIGSKANPLLTSTSNISATAGGAGSNDISITNTGNLANFKATAAGTGSVTLVNSGNVTLNGIVDGPSGVIVTLGAGSTLTNSGLQFKSSSGPVTITADNLVLTGATAILTASNTASIKPSTAARPISLGAVGTPGAELNLSEAQINSISAKTLIIGSNSTTGGIAVNSNLNITNGTELQLLQGTGSFTSTGKSIALTAGKLDLVLGAGAINAGAISCANDATGQVSLITQGDITLSAGVPVCHRILLNAGTGKINGLPATINSPQDAGGNGGSLTLRASNLQQLNMTINVNGTGTGNGGLAVYQSTSILPVTVTAANLVVNASGKDSGTVTISSGSDLSINPSSGVINAVPTGSGAGQGKGPTINLEAGSTATAGGKLAVTGSLNADGVDQGAGGYIQLKSKSKTVFNLGLATATNGAQGTLSVAAGPNAAAGNNGTVEVINSGGGIISSTFSLANAKQIILNTSGSTAGPITIGAALGSADTNSISLIAGGSGAINTKLNALIANTVSLTSVTGAIGATLNAANVSANMTGSTGAGAVTLSSTATDTNLLASSSRGAFTLSSTAGNITTTGTVSAGTNLTLKSTAADGSIIVNSTIGSNTTTGTAALTATGNGVIEGTGTVQGKTLNLTTAAAGRIGLGSTLGVTALNIRALSLAANTTAPVNISNLGLGSSVLTVTTSKTTSTFTLDSANAMKVSAAMPAVTQLRLRTAGASALTVTGAMGNSTPAKNVTTLIALSSTTGAITGSGTLATTTGGSVAIATAGDVGTAIAPVKVKTPSISVANAKLINISDTLTGTGVTVTSPLSATGSLNFSSGGDAIFNGAITGASVKLKTAGTSTFNESISATGGTLSFSNTKAASTSSMVAGKNVSATSTIAMTMSGAASFGGSNISSSGGSITITSKGATSLGVVSSGPGLAITLTQSGTAGAGNFDIDGASASSNFTLSTNGSGITTNGQILAQSGNVSIKTTGLNTGITLGGNVLSNNSSSGIVTLTANGTGNITSTGFIQGRTITFVSGSGEVRDGTVATNPIELQPLAGSPVTVAVNSKGTAILNNVSTTSPLTLSLANTSSQPFTLTSASPITSTSSIANASTITLNSAGNLVLNGATLGGTTKTTGPITLTATNSGNITGNATISVAPGGTVSLNAAGNIGTSPTVALKVKADSVTATSTGFLNLNETGSTLTTFGNLLGSSVTVNSGGPSKFNGNVTSSNGAIKLTQTTGLMEINGDLSATGAVNSLIVLQEKAIKLGSGITFNGGSSLITNFTGVKPTATPLPGPFPGQITVAIGPTIPATPILGTQPLQASVSGNSGIYTVYWGAPGGTVAQGLPAENALTIQGDTAIVFFGNSTSPITLAGAGTGLTMLADPPFSSSAAAAVTQALPPAAKSILTQSLTPPSVPLRSALQVTQPVVQKSDLQNTFQMSPTFTADQSKYILANASSLMPASRQHSREESDSTQPASKKSGSAGFQTASISEAGFALRAESFESANPKSAELDLTSGNLLLTPSTNTVVDTPFGKVSVSANSIALLHASDDILAVYNIDDHHNNSVVLHKDGKEFSLSPGRQLMVSKHEHKSFREANPFEEIAYRNISESELKGSKLFCSEFSIPSTISSIKPLQQLFQASRLSEAEKLRKHLLKTIAAMSQFKIGSPYTQIRL